MIPMLKLSSTILNQPVLSLRSGGQIATTSAVLVNPNNLSIAGLYCTQPRDKKLSILLPDDIREWVPQGFAVDDHDSLTDPDDLIRLKETIAINYQLIGKPVYSKSKRRIGKVTDYALEDTTYRIQKLYVGQTIVKNLSGTGLVVDRNQIIELNDRRVIITDPLQGVPQTAPVAA